MTTLLFKSTRSSNEQLQFSEAVVKGMASDGGLFVPTTIPKVNFMDNSFISLSYQEIAEKILTLFATDFSTEEIKHCVRSAYNGNFQDERIVPIKTCGSANFLELYHGKTLAFKDMALSILPHLMTLSSKKLGIKEHIVILAATSGDTGKAALEGFAKVEGIDIMVFYPTDGVSHVQQRQMVTQEGDNTHVYGIKGNFDDAQNGVKKIFSDLSYQESLKEKGYILSSANSINIGRLIPQIIYYIYGYFQLVGAKKIQLGDPINVAVPTGNFGNILAAYYAREMGLPIKSFICASNHNNVLTDFFKTGVYDRNRSFVPTVSPSMDILISSNLERFLFAISGENPTKIHDLMTALKTSGRYEVTETMKANMKSFYGGYADDAQTIARIQDLYRDFNYVVDTHTAVAYHVYKQYVKDTGDETQTLIASTASPFKFPRSVLDGLGIDTQSLDDFALIALLSEKTGLEIPSPINTLDKKPIRHKGIGEKDGLSRLILASLIK